MAIGDMIEELMLIQGSKEKSDKNIFSGGWEGIKSSWNNGSVRIRSTLEETVGGDWGSEVAKIEEREREAVEGLREDEDMATSLFHTGTSAIGQTVPVFVTSALGTLITGNPIVGVALGIGTIFTQTYGETVKDYRESNPNLDEATIKGYAAISSIIQSTIEQGLGNIPYLGKLVSRGATKEIIKKVGKNKIFKFVKDVGMNGLEEGGEEVLQAFSDGVVKSIMNNRNEIPNADELISQFSAGFQGGIFLSGIVEGGKLLRNKNLLNDKTTTQQQSTPINDFKLTENNQEQNLTTENIDLETEVSQHNSEETIGTIKSFMEHNFPQFKYETVTTDTIDENTKKQAKLQGADVSSIEAWIDKKTEKIFINSQVIAPHNVPRVIFHELVGHHGLPNVIGKKNFNDFLLKIWKENRTEIEKKKEAYSNISNLALTEEWLADNANKYITDFKNMGFFQKAITSFKNLLRSLPFTKDVRYTNNDISNLMQKAFKYTQNQPRNEAQIPIENKIIKKAEKIKHYTTKIKLQENEALINMNTKLSRLEKDKKIAKMGAFIDGKDERLQDLNIQIKRLKTKIKEEEIKQIAQSNKKLSLNQKNKKTRNQSGNELNSTASTGNQLKTSQRLINDRKTIRTDSLKGYNIATQSVQQQHPPTTPHTSITNSEKTKFSIKTNLNLQDQAHITKIKEFDRKINLKDTADIRNYLKEHFAGQKIEIKSDGRLAVISNAGIKSAVKKRGIHRETFSSLDEIIENSYFVGYEKNDGKEKHAYLDGQFIYTSLIDLNNQQFIAEIKLDDSIEDKRVAIFKDIVIEKASLYAGLLENSNRSLPEAGFHKLNIGQIIQNIKTKFKDNPRFQENSSEKTKFSLTAPNGKPSNLNQTQHTQVRTPEFKQWFGDWENDPQNASKVVDQNGEPLIVYHGTSNDFNTFDKNKIGSKPDNGLFGKGFYFSNKKVNYGNKHLETYLSIKNPFMWKEHAKNKKQIAEILEISEDWFSESGGGGFRLSNEGARFFDISYTLSKKGFDGVIIKHNEKFTEIVAFEPNQIKSATENNGDFSNEDNDIRFSIGANRKQEMDTLLTKKRTDMTQAQRTQTIDQIQQLRETTKDGRKISADDNVRFSLTAPGEKNLDVLEKNNKRFNRELDLLIENILPKTHIFQLGHPSTILQSTNIPNLPIELSSTRLLLKADQNYKNDHPFKLSEIKNLVKLINDPIMIFKYDNEKNQNLLLEIQHDNKNYLIGLMLGENNIKINTIRTIFPKNISGIIKWIKEDKLLYIDKKRAKKLLIQQQTNSADVNEVKLSSVWNIIKEFLNPTPKTEKTKKFSIQDPKKHHQRPIDDTHAKILETKNYIPTSHDQNTKKAQAIVEKHGFDTTIEMILNNTLNLLTPQAQLLQPILRLSPQWHKLSQEIKETIAIAYTESGKNIAQAMQARKEQYKNPLIDTTDKNLIKADLLLKLETAQAKAKKDNKKINYLEKIKKSLNIDIETTNFNKLQENKIEEIITKVHTTIASIFDKIYEFWINSILSGPHTHIVNITSNTLNTAYHLGPKRLVEATLNLILKNKNSATFGEILYMWKALNPLQSLRENWHKRKEVHVQGGKFELAGKPAIGGKLGKIIRTPGTFLYFADQIAKDIIIKMESITYAYRQAKNNNIPKNQLQQYITSTSQSKSAQTYAQKQAEHLTFQDHPGDWTAQIILARNKKGILPGLLKFALPFLNTPINILKQGIKYSPLGTIKLINDLKNNKFKLSPTLIADTAAQLTAWTVLSSILATDNDDDDEWITGTSDAPYNTTKRQIQPPEKSIKILGKWVSYANLEPIATILTTIVDATKKIKNAKNTDNYLENFMQFIQQTTKQLYNKSFFNTLTEFNKISQDQDYAYRYLANFPSSWVPNIIRSTINATKENIPEYNAKSKNIQELFDLTLQRSGFKNRLPKIDYFGREIKKDDYGDMPSSIVLRLLSPIEIKPADNQTQFEKSILKYNQKNPDSAYFPSIPSKYYNNKTTKEKTAMTNHQYHQFCITAGKLAKIKIQHAIKTKQININFTEKDIKKIKQTFKEAKKEAKQIHKLQ